VELFLLDRHVQYRHLPARSERAHLCVNFYSNDVPVTLTVFPENDLRRSTNKGENSALERARIDQLQKLIADSSSGQTNEQLQMLTSSAG
jgi:hypothetical protein